MKSKKIILISILIALGVVFSYFDGLISRTILAAMPMVAILVPHFKFGFANIVVMLFVYNYRFEEGFIAILLKSLIVGLIFGETGPITFCLSFSGAFLSFFVMKLLVKVFPNVKAMVFISAIGGFMHALGQLLMSFLILQPGDVRMFLVYSPLFLLSGIITGCLVGIISKKINASVMKHLQYS